MSFAVSMKSILRYSLRPKMKLFRWFWYRLQRSSSYAVWRENQAAYMRSKPGMWLYHRKSIQKRLEIAFSDEK